MTTLHRFTRIVRRWPVTCFCILTLGITWGSLYGADLLLPKSVFVFLTQNILPKGLPQAFSLTGILASYGPSLAGLTIVAVCSGRSGVNEWLARWMRWRVSWKWYAAALLCAPVLFVVQHLVTHPARAFDRLFLHSAPGEVRDAVVGFFLLIHLYFPYVAGEEGGWRGFVLPHLQARYGPIWASCMIAPLWLAWHLPGVPPAMATSLVQLRALLVMMLFCVACTWIFNGAQGSILPVVLWHATTDAMGDMERHFFPLTGDLAPGHAIGDWILWPIVALVLIWLTRGRLGYRNDEMRPRQSEKLM